MSFQPFAQFNAMLWQGNTTGILACKVVLGNTPTISHVAINTHGNTLSIVRSSTGVYTLTCDCEFGSNSIVIASRGPNGGAFNNVYLQTDVQGGEIIITSTSPFGVPTDATAQDVSILVLATE
jgi:hypothetical protein